MNANPDGNLIVNDFNIQIATVNGSGSQSANMVLMRSIFQMGVPVSGKNLFPSNIAGLPTWFTIRASKDGYTARKAEIDFMVALNPQTARQDAASVRPGGALLADEALGLKGIRSDISFYEAPFMKLAAEITSESRIRKLLANMVYVGILGRLLSIDPREIETGLEKQFRSKSKVVELNLRAVKPDTIMLPTAWSRPTVSFSGRWTKRGTRSSSTETEPRPWAQSSAAAQS